MRHQCLAVLAVTVFGTASVAAGVASSNFSVTITLNGGAPAAGSGGGASGGGGVAPPAPGGGAGGAVPPPVGSGAVRPTPLPDTGPFVVVPPPTPGNAPGEVPVQRTSPLLGTVRAPAPSGPGVLGAGARLLSTGALLSRTERGGCSTQSQLAGAASSIVVVTCTQGQFANMGPSQGGSYTGDDRFNVESLQVMSAPSGRAFVNPANTVRALRIVNVEGEALELWISF